MHPRDLASRVAQVSGTCRRRQGRLPARRSKKAHLNRESLYRMLSGKGNPQLSSLVSILKSAGLRLAVEVTEPKLA